MQKLAVQRVSPLIDLSQPAYQIRDARSLKDSGLGLGILRGLKERFQIIVHTQHDASDFPIFQHQTVDTAELGGVVGN